ncbi:hypothetical protein MKW94_016241 [Papaver nudicaule]|uniref:FMR1-interacting protein 1 conserved domain-containing protein n=1 Tax=Papaver nudicaule TaxID=74823 RepID=A0AA41SGB0_PAPNU|nr:hypothetical protein [Papaver nudicaule]
MFPFQPPFPCLPNQTQMEGRNFPTPQQVVPSNQCVTNPSHFSNGFNPGVALPYGIFTAMPNAHYLNVANPHPQMQNSQVGRPFLGSGPHNMNSVMASPQCGNPQNISQNTSQFQPMQQQGPLFMQTQNRPFQSYPQAVMFNPYNQPMPMNQPTGFPQSQFVQLPGNPSQASPYSAHPCPNPQWGNQQMGFMNSSGVASQNAQGKHAFNPNPAARNTSPKISQGNNTHDNGNGASNIMQKNLHNKKFTRNHQKSGRGESSNSRFQKSKFQARGTAKGNFKSNKGEKAQQNAGPGKSVLDNSVNQASMECKRNLRPNYTEQEIQQWRAERKKNHPLRSNAKKRLAGKHSEDIDGSAKRRRQQLKEILAKQAELGVEVAELPPDYLTDSENPICEKEGRFQKEHNKGRRYKLNRFSRKQQAGKEEGSAAQPDTCREPTLLQKLLSADIKRERSHLLQVFRFMVINDFFKDPEKPLEFPVVTVKGESKGNISEDESSPIGDHGNSILEGDEEDEDSDDEIDDVASTKTIISETNESDTEEGELTE